MQSSIEQFKFFFRGFWNYRWLALIAAAAISILGWFLVVTAPDRYEVTTRVFIDTRSMLKPLLKGIAVDSTLTESTAGMMQRTLLSRPNLERVAKQSGLDANVETPADYEKLIAALAEKIIITGGKDQHNLYTIVYENSNPVMAKNVVQSLLDLFIERVVGANRLDTDVTKRFLDQKIKEYEVKLTAAEERLKEFKKEHPGALVTDDRTYFTRLEAMKTQLQTARLELQEFEQRQEALKAQLATTPAYTGGAGAVVGQNLIDINIAQQRAELEALQLKFTELHPDVAAAKRKLSQLQEQKRSGYTGGRTSAQAAVPATVNPVYQGLKISLSEAGARIASLKARTKEYEQRLKEMEASGETIPDIEAKLARLDRDYNVNKTEYEELLRRREAADISEGVSNADELQFEIIEAPRVPVQPTGPNRLKWITMVFMFALATGIGGAIFLSMLRPKIYDKSSLRKITTLPVLGTVSELNSVGGSLVKGAGRVSYSLVSGCLLLLYAALILTYLTNAEFARQFAGYDYSEKVQEQLGDEVLSPIKDALDEI